MTKAELKGQLSWYRMHESIDKMMAHKFLDISQKRGKALGILLPLLQEDVIADLLAELYDVRNKLKNKELEIKLKELKSKDK